MGWTAGVGCRQATKAKQEEGASRELLLPYAAVERASIVKILLPWHDNQYKAALKRLTDRSYGIKWLEFCRKALCKEAMASAHENASWNEADVPPAPLHRPWGPLVAQCCWCCRQRHCRRRAASGLRFRRCNSRNQSTQQYLPRAEAEENFCDSGNWDL